MITPMDIQEKEFSRSIKGFREDEVNEFLDQITLDLERLIEDNRQLRMENDRMRAELEKFQTAEHSVIETLDTAKAMMNDIASSAEKRAQMLLKNAELEVATMMREATEKAARMNEENAQNQNKLASFRKKYRELLEAEMRQLDGSVDELFAELSMEDLSEIPEAAPAPARPQSQEDARTKLDRTMIHFK